MTWVIHLIVSGTIFVTIGGLHSASECQSFGKQWKHTLPHQSAARYECIRELNK
jgi:hypothetical protein